MMMKGETGSMAVVARCLTVPLSSFYGIEQVDDSDDGAEVARRAPRGSVFNAAGSAAQAASAHGHHRSTGGRGWHPAAQAREMSWGPRPIRPLPVPAVMTDAAAAAGTYNQVW